MGKLLEFILLTIIAYFIFKFLNRLFSRPSNPTQSSYQYQQKTKKSYSKKDIKWDAETIDYEEIENKDHDKK